MWLPSARRVAHVENPPRRHLYQSRVQSLLFAPLLQVPPASRGEPSRAPTRFPLRAGGNLKEGVLVYPYFCELWLSDWQVSLRWFFDSPPSQPPPWTGEEPRLPPRPRGGLGWGRCLNLYARALISLSPNTFPRKQSASRRSGGRGPSRRVRFRGACGR